MEEITIKGKTFNLRNIIMKLLMAFLIAQPILDMYMVQFDDKISLMGISLATIIRCLWIGVMGILTLYLARKRKNTKFFLGYLVIVGIYTVFHHLNSTKLDPNMLNDQVRYSFVSEMFYIIRMLIPMALIYIVYNIRPTYKEIKIIVVTVVLMMSFAVIITNLLGIDHISYSLSPKQPEDTIVGWFIHEQTPSAWRSLTSKGLFDAGNEISAIYVILLPLSIYIALKEKKLWYYAVPMLQLIIMTMSGTRIACLGSLGIVAGMFVLYIIMQLVEKKKIEIPKIMMYVAMSCIFLAIFMQSPFELRKRVEGIKISYNNIDSEEKEEVKKEEEFAVQTEFASEEEKYQYIETYTEEAGLNVVFTEEIYPYQKDPDFWIRVMNEEPRWKYGENRGMKTLLLARVQERNNNPADKWLGMSFGKISTFTWPERDFEAQYYYLGIVGLALLILPYIIVLVYGGIMVLLKWKTKFNMKNAVYLACLLFGLAAGYYSGHVLDELFVTTYLGFISGMCLVNASQKEKVEELDKQIEK